RRPRTRTSAQRRAKHPKTIQRATKSVKRRAKPHLATTNRNSSRGKPPDTIAGPAAHGSAGPVPAWEPWETPPGFPRVPASDPWEPPARPPTDGASFKEACQRAAAAPLGPDTTVSYWEACLRAR